MPWRHRSSERGNLEMLWKLWLGDFQDLNDKAPGDLLWIQSTCRGDLASSSRLGWRPLKVLSTLSASTIHFHLHLLQLWFIFLKYARLELYTAFQRISSRIYEVIINLPKSIANASPFSARRPQLPRVCISVTLQYSSPVQTIPWHRTSNLHYTTLTTCYVQDILMLMQLILLLLIQPLR